MLKKHLPPRWDSKNAWYFVTVVTHKRHPYFKSEEACRMLLDSCRSVREIHPYRVGALMIMPDHWHALVRPQENEVVESIVGSIKQRVFHTSRQGGGQVIRWQTRFMDHRIRDEADYFQHVEYMRLNPYRQQLVGDERESWKWWFVHRDPFA
jgi:putative transposase